MQFPNQNCLNLALLTPHTQCMAQDRKTSQFYPSNFLSSQPGPISGILSESQKAGREPQIKPKSINKNCLDALMTTNSSLSSSDQFDDIQAKDLNEDTKKLCKFFKMNKYPTKEELRELSVLTNRSAKHLETWFKNRRRALAMKGMLPTYQRKNKFTKQEADLLKDFFSGLKKPKKSHFEQIHLKLNKECSIKNIKNWFNHYKKKMKMGVSERHKRVKVDEASLNRSQEATQNTQDTTNNGNTSSIGTQLPRDVNYGFNYVQNPSQTMSIQSFPIQKTNPNQMVIVPLMPNVYPCTLVQKTPTGPMLLQNYCMSPQNQIIPINNGMGINFIGNKAQNSQIGQIAQMGQIGQMGQNMGYFLIVNQPNQQITQIPQNNVMIQSVYGGNECRSAFKNGST